MHSKRTRATAATAAAAVLLTVVLGYTVPAIAEETPPVEPGVVLPQRHARGPQPRRQPVEVGHEQGGVGLPGGRERLLHAEVDLCAGRREPAAAAGGQRPRLRQLRHPQQPAVEGASQLLAHIVARATGVDIEEYAATHVFAPLGIRDWFWKRTPSGVPALRT